LTSSWDDLTANHYLFHVFLLGLLRHKYALLFTRKTFFFTAQRKLGRVWTQEETAIQPMANSITRWCMYAKALKGHIPDIADQLSGQGYDRRERKMAREERLMWAQTPSDERYISRGEKQQSRISLQRLRLSLQGLNSKDQG